MSSGIRAEVVVRAPLPCTVAQVSASTDTTINTVTRSQVADESGAFTEEFVVDTKDELDRDDVEHVFNFGSQSVYRFERESSPDCVCERIESFECPVSSIRAREGALFLTFYADELDQIKDIIEDLRSEFSSVGIHHLTRSEDSSTEELVLVDRSALTARQLEVLQTAYDMGYFSHPKGANASEVAENIGISPSTFSEHLAAAQSKILKSLLD